MCIILAKSFHRCALVRTVLPRWAAAHAVALLLLLVPASAAFAQGATIANPDWSAAAHLFAGGGESSRDPRFLSSDSPVDNNGNIWQGQNPRPPEIDASEKRHLHSTSPYLAGVGVVADLGRDYTGVSVQIYGSRHYDPGRSNALRVYTKSEADGGFNINSNNAFVDVAGLAVTATVDGSPVGGGTGNLGSGPVRYVAIVQSKNAPLQLVEIDFSASASIDISDISGPATEAGGQASFDVGLNSQPAANVTLTISSTDETEGTVSPANLTFTTTNWDAPQTVMVSGVDDNVVDGAPPYDITLTSSSADANYDAMTTTVEAMTTDDDVVGLVVSDISGQATEGGGTAIFNVSLATRPGADVTVAVTSGDVSEGTVSPPSLTFTTTNWDAPQTVTVTGMDDTNIDGIQTYDITLDTSSEDADGNALDTDYNTLASSTVSVTTTDDETVGMTVSDIHGQATEAGDPARFQVRLNSQPAADVTIVISSGDITEGTVSPPSLTFTTTDWNTARSVRIDGVDDLIADGPQTYDITLDPSSEDADGNALDTDYNTLASNIVSVITTDDERTGIVVSPTSGQATEGGGTSSFAVALETPPSANVNVVISSGDITEGTVSPPSLTFTTTDWNVLQAVTVTGVDDTDIDGPQTYDINLIASSSDAYNSVMSAVSVTTTDNETAGITLSATQLSLDEGATTMLAVRLDRAPTNDVTVTVLSEDTTGGTVFPANLTFTTTNWAIPQTVTVTGVDDFIDDGDQTYAISLTGVSSDLDYNTLAATAYATTLDDDTASMAVSPTALIFAENGSGTLTVQLGTQPTGDVTVSVKSGDVGEGTVSPTSLTFTSSDWNVPQMVSVNGVDNNDADGTRTYHVSLTPETSTVVEYYGSVANFLAD